MIIKGRTYRATLVPYRRGYRYALAPINYCGPAKYSQWFANKAEAERALSNRGINPNPMTTNDKRPRCPNTDSVSKQTQCTISNSRGKGEGLPPPATKSVDSANSAEPSPRSITTPCSSSVVTPIISWDQSDRACHLLVSGAKTNVWFWLPSYRHYRAEEQDPERDRAYNLAILIHTGQVYPYGDDSWERFDRCARCDFEPVEVVQVPDNYETPKLHLWTRSCGAPDREAELAELRKPGAFRHTQWIKRLSDDCSQVYHRVGVKFYNYGLAVFAME